MRPISILNFLPTFLPVSWIVNLNNFVQNILLFLSFLFLLSPSLSLFLLFTFYIFNLSFFIYIWYTRTQVVMRHVRKILWHPTLTRSLPTHSICPLIRTQKNGSKLLKLCLSQLSKSMQKGKFLPNCQRNPCFKIWGSEHRETIGGYKDYQPPTMP